MFNLFRFLFGNDNKRSTVSRETEEKIISEWHRINDMMSSKQPSQFKNALINADKTIDNALNDFTRGKNMGERLKNAKQRFSPHTYNKLWEAHKVRNAFVHESGYEPPYYVVEEAIGDFRKALQELNINV